MCWVFIIIFQYVHWEWIFKVLETAGPFQKLFEGKMSLWLWVRLWKICISQEKTNKQYLERRISVSVYTYLFSEGNVALKKMFPFYIITNFLVLFVRTINIHILGKQTKLSISREGKGNETILCLYILEITYLAHCRIGQNSTHLFQMTKDFKTIILLYLSINVQ